MMVLVWAVALFFALNIGASGTAASMGAAYGGGAVNRRWVALLLAALSVFLGAVLGGGNVVHTIGHNIVPDRLLTPAIVVIILSGACITLFLANMLRVPLSTSEVTVGSLLGVGVAFRSIYATHVLFLFFLWIMLPFAAFFAAYAVGKGIGRFERRLGRAVNVRRVEWVLRVVLVGAGCYEAFAAGMNNVANAVGPLVGAGLIGTQSGLVWGALFVALGAIVLGGRTLETNAKKITELSLVQGSVVSLISGTLVIIVSLLGFPFPLTQATTMSIFGVGSAKSGFGLFRKDIVRRVLVVWITSPVSSLVVSFLLVRIFVEVNLYGVVIVVSSFIMASGYLSFFRPRRKAPVKTLSPLPPSDANRRTGSSAT